jgi:tRNA pseudouridine38-40 synthase
MKPSSVKSRLIKATVAYHGAKFSGWQIQRQGERTVQSVFESALQKVTRQRPQLVVASRTDAGVHASRQIIHFKLTAGQRSGELTADRLRDALNFHLPQDVAVKQVQFMTGRFDARRGSKKKHYRYEIHASRVKPVFDTDTACWVRMNLNVDWMRRAAQDFVGRHDFTSFSALSDDCEERTRTILSFTVKRSGDRIICDIVGDSFLQHMIRIMMGTLIEIARGHRPRTDIPRLLKAKNRLLSGPTAAPHGLTLVKVYY